MSVQIENGYTRIANELLLAMCKLKLSDREWRVVHAIMRKTYGYQKKDDSISLQQFEEMTGIKTKHLPAIIHGLEEKKIIIVSRKKYISNYSLNKEYPKWGTPQTGSKTTPQTGSKTTPQTGRYKRKKEKRNSVEKISTSGIIIKKQHFSMSELQYVSEHDDYIRELTGGIKREKDAIKNANRKSRSPYGNKTMAIIAKAFAEAAGIPTNQSIDATPWLRPLSAIYRHFDNDVYKTIAFIKKSTGYFEEQGLAYNVNTLHKNMHLIDKWIKQKKGDAAQPNRRILE